MLKRTEVSIEPGIDIKQIQTYLQVYEQFSPNLPKGFEYCAKMGWVPFMAVNHWADELNQLYPNLQFRGLSLLFDREVKDILGRDETGQDLLIAKHPNFSSFLAIDVASYMFGFRDNEIAAAIGNKPFIEKIFTDIYGRKFPAIQITAPKQGV